MTNKNNFSIRGKNSGSVRTASLLLLALLLAVAFIGYLPQLARVQYASADSALVQDQTGSIACTPLHRCVLLITFPSSVTTGDVIVAVVGDFGAPVQLSPVTDSLGLSYFNEINFGGTYILAAQVTSTGTDTVNFTDATGNSGSIHAEVFEVSGVSTARAQTALGYNVDLGCTYAPCGISTNSTVSFVPGAFLISAVSPDDSGADTTTGFTNQTLVSGILYAQYSTSGVTSPTDFPVRLWIRHRLGLRGL